MLDLEKEFTRLNPEQRLAVKYNSNTVVLAGPGSGKTATLVIKVAHLLNEKITPPRGLACITYNNDAVREFRGRLADFGLYAGRRLFLGTVHSFCLNCILRPYARLVQRGFQNGVVVAGSKKANDMLQTALDEYFPDLSADRHRPSLTKLQRLRACGEDISGFDDRELLVLEKYEKILGKLNLVDFESMVTFSLAILTEFDWVTELLQARFPWLIVDEYQDLGGPLHRIVTHLVDSVGIKVFAVGDPDQTIYDFTGANPKYLEALSKRKDFTSFFLKFNYRSGQRLIDAGQAALAPRVPREYQADPQRQDAGEVFFIRAADTLEDHAVKTALTVKNLLADGMLPEQVAIFYQRRTILLSDLRTELDAHGIAYFPERDLKYPVSPLVKWLQEGAAWALATVANKERTFEYLFRFYEELLMSAGHVDRQLTFLEHRAKLFEALRQPVEDSLLLHYWLKEVVEHLDLLRLVGFSPEHSDDLENLELMISQTAPDGPLEDLRAVEFAEDGRVRGKVVLTTFHSSKGRQFDAVVIPGLVEGVLPPWNWDRRQYRYVEMAERPLRSLRRLFYVGFTRARYIVYLICSEAYVYKGHEVNLGISRFATEIQRRLDQV